MECTAWTRAPPAQRPPNRPTPSSTPAAPDASAPVGRPPHDPPTPLPLSGSVGAYAAPTPRNSTHPAPVPSPWSVAAGTNPSIRLNRLDPPSEWVSPPAAADPPDWLDQDSQP